MMKIVRVNVGTDEVTYEDTPEKYRLMGGRQLTDQLVCDEVDPLCHPLGPNNKLFLAPGLFTGTGAPSSARISAGSKSPLTGGIKESNAGGTAALKLARLGIKVLVLEGHPEKGEEDEFKMLVVTKDGVQVKSAQHLFGLGNYDTVAELQKEYGKKVGMITIGQAGEERLHSSSIAVTDMEGYPSRHCGRGGLGAVMGAKKIKAIIVDDTGSKYNIEMANKAEFTAICKEWTKEMLGTKKGLNQFGTLGTVDVMNALGALPTKNFKLGAFDEVDQINAPAFRAYVESTGGMQGHACSPGCIIRCSQYTVDENGDHFTAGIEYETVCLFGSNLMNSDLSSIAKINRMCDDFGVDTIDVGVAAGVALEAGVVEWGDTEGIVNMVAEIGKKSYLGRILGHGAEMTGRVFSRTRIPTTKGQAFAAYDPRATKGIAMTYATTPMGADHTAGNCLPGRGAWRGNTNFAEKEEFTKEISRDLQINSTIIDSLGFCLFVGPMVNEMQKVAKLMTAFTGEEYTMDDITRIGLSILKNEITFNRAAGLGKHTDRLPEWCLLEQNDPTGKTAQDILPEDLEYIHADFDIHPIPDEPAPSQH